jgi:small conductance mechanosensitive channel
MLNSIAQFFNQNTWWSTLTRIGLFYTLAWIVHLSAPRLARRMVRLSHFSPKSRQTRPERQLTLQSLIASTLRGVAVIAASLASLGQFVRTDTLIWMVGLFSAAFGLGARPLISDLLTGIGLIFEDTFAVGEKVEILQVEGVIEAVNLRTTCIRAPTGELYIVPNGEVRVVRNFSRGRFSLTKVQLQIPTADLNLTLTLLEELGQEAVSLLPNLLEPWQVLSESGVVGQHTELTLLAKARFGQAAEMRPRLLALVQERLSEADIALAN